VSKGAGGEVAGCCYSDQLASCCWFEDFGGEGSFGAGGSGRVIQLRGDEWGWRGFMVIRLSYYSGKV
jgi:hypothetical protein